ncbi:MAG: S8 family serine peptidase [Verrucomicrobia bacterium]|nr:S8 family serine peptidase [Verrucomicrobiota bacterium]
MRLKFKTWALISAVCFIGAIAFWKLGDRQTGRQRASGEEGSTSTNNVDVPRDQSSALPVIAPVLLLASTSLEEFRAKAVDVENPLRYRLNNTEQTASQLGRNEKGLLLRNALIDTSSDQPLAIPRELRATEDPGSYVIQSRQKLNDAFRAQLRAADAEIISYVPNNAYLVRVAAAGARKLASLPQTQSVLPYEPYFKLDTAVLERAIENKPFEAGAALRVTLFPGGEQLVMEALQAVNARIIGKERSPFGPELIIQVPSEALVALAQLPLVQNIEFHTDRVTANDLARVRVGVSANSSNLFNTFGLTGTNVLVNVNDTGVDVSHPDLTNRVHVSARTLATDVDGHGTHVAGIIASSGANGPFPATNAIGSEVGAQFRGMADGASILSQDLFEFFDWEMQEFAARTNLFLFGRTNALISNNSWHYIGAFGYNSASASFDAAVRDAIPGVTGSQPVLFVFAAGNGGGGNSGGSGGFPGRVASPATAKNVITVGAIESPRGITNRITRTNSFGTVTTNSEYLPLTDSSNQVARFSGRGNVGIGIEGDFGRFKPDVVAPGTFVVSTRSGQWDTNSYYNPTNISGRVFTNLVIGAGQTNSYALFVPNNTVEFWIEALPNGHSAVPFPSLQLYTNFTLNPSTDAANFSGTNALYLQDSDAGFSSGVEWFYDFVNTSSSTVRFDIRTVLFTTNNLGDSMQVLEGMNNDLIGPNGPPPHYRYETGTSMAAPVVSGMLALLQEYLETRISPAVSNASPALMKALLINSARSAGPFYDLDIKNNINYQGWGLPNLGRMLPGGGTNTAGIMFFDQSETNALATDEQHTREILLSEDAQESALRFSLVWTDPPGNPAVGIKLVNDLDLVVTNLDTGDVYFGNNFPGGGDYSDINFFVDGTNAPVVINSERDIVNNVENVYLNGPLNARYAVSIIGRRVNVNAVTAQTNGIKQDYALVVSIGDLTITNAITLSNLVITADIQANVTSMTNLNGGAAGEGYSFSIMMEQRVGANNPYEVQTNGTLNQWLFYAFTNTFGYSNVAFAVFGGINLSGINVRDYQVPSLRNLESDIDLYVSTDPALLNLDIEAIDLAHKSVERGGNELIILTDEPQTPGQVYYIGVKSEDQRASEFSILAISSELPFASDENGNVVPLFFPIPAEIKDGSPDAPGHTDVFGIVPFDRTIRRIIVTNEFDHQLFGDLVGVLYKQGIGKSVILNNHGFPGGQSSGIIENIYNDLNEGDTPYAHPSDGPGSLADFVGEKTRGLWFFTVSDNALTHTGQVLNFSFYIEPQPEDDSSNGGSEIIRKPVCKPIFANNQRYDAVTVPNFATNLTVNVSFTGGGTIEVYVRREALPTIADYDYKAIFNAPGGALRIGTGDLPPLTPGVYYIMYRNPGANVIDPVCWFTRIGLDLSDVTYKTYGMTNGAPLIDDAYTNSVITVTNTGLVGDVQVGVRIDHPRVSDLSLHLVSPSGTRILLFENRGGLSTTGLGGDSTTFDQDVNLNISKFEGSFTGNVSAPNTFQGWSVVSNQVTVTSDNAIAQQGDKYLELRSGSISRTLPTQPGRQYTLNYIYRASPTNTFPPTARVQVGSLAPVVHSGTAGWQMNSIPFVGAGVGTSLKIDGLTANMLIDNFFLLEEAIFSPVSHIVFTENTNLFPELIKFALPPFGATNLGAFVTTRSENSFEGIPPGEVPPGSVVEDWTVTSPNASVVTTPLAVDGANVLSLNNLLGGANEPLGAITRSYTNGPGTSYELKFSYRTPADSSDPTDAPARATIIIDGVLTTLTPEPNWNTFRTFFQPEGTDFTIDIAALTNGVWIDGMTLIQRVSGNYFYPEESLRLLTGEPAKGDWILEVWDNRLGAEINANIISWQLQLTILGDTTTAPTPQLLLNGVTATGTVVSNEIRYFVVDVPVSAAHATNFLTSLTGGQLELLFNQSTPPTGLGFGDFSLLQTPTPSRTLDTTSAPLLQPGQRYYLGVRNVNPTDSNNFTVLVKFDFVDNFVAGIPALTNAIAFNTNAPSGNAMQYFQFNVSPGALMATFELLNLTGNADLYIRYGAPVPSYSSYHYGSQNIGNSDELIVVSSSSTPVNLGPGTWYIGVLNLEPVPVDYSVKATEYFESDFNIIDLTPGVPVNGISYTGTLLTNYYRFVIDQTNSSALFEIFDLTGDVDLLVSRGSFPTRANHDIANPDEGTFPEEILVDGGMFPPDLNGTWYLVVVNNEAFDVDFTIQASVSPEIQQPPINIIPLISGAPTNGIAGTGTAITNFYSFVIDQTNSSVLFELFNLSGDGDLLVRFGDLPTLDNYDWISSNAGISPEQIVINTNGSLPELNGTWYLAVPNNEAFDLDFTIHAVVSSPNGVLLSGQPLQIISGPVIEDGSVKFQWNSVPGQTYEIQVSTDLITWVTEEVITAVGSVSDYVSPPIEGASMQFYRVIQVPPPSEP